MSAIAKLEVAPASEQLRTSASTWLSWVGKGSLAILDQGLFASSNFLLSVLLARWLAPSDYGAFALAFSVFLLIGVFHTAMFTEPMLVFGPGKYRQQIPEYLGILLSAHFALMIPASLLLATTAFLLGRLNSPAVERAFLALAVAGPFILLLWLMRRAFYILLNPGMAAAGGAVYFLVLLGSTLALHANRRLTPTTGFLTMAAGSFIVCLFFYVILRPVFTAKSCTIRFVASDHWRYGKWVVASALPGWAIENIYFLVLPLWVSLADVGALEALMNLAMPALHAISALGVLILPVLVHNRERSSSMQKTMKLSLALFFLGSSCYLVLLWVFRLPLFHFLYASKYSGYDGGTILLVGMIPFAESLSVVVGGALRALEQPIFVFWSCVGGGAVAVACGVPLTYHMGIAGALVGITMSYFLMGILSLLFLARSLHQEMDVARK